MKKLTFILILVLCSWSLFGQDSIKTQRNKFYIGVGININIPTMQPYPTFLIGNPTSIDRIILPQTTVGSNIQGGYNFKLFEKDKFDLSIKPEISLKYYNIKSISEEYYSISSNNNL